MEVDSVSNMGEAPIQLDYKAPSVIDEGKMEGTLKKQNQNFQHVMNPNLVLLNWEGDIDIGDGENISGQCR